MVSPSVTPTGRVKRYRTWQAALTHAMKGVEVRDRFAVVGEYETRAEAFAQRDQEGASALLFELAQGYHESGEPEEAERILALSERMHEWIAWAQAGGDDLPWEVNTEVTNTNPNGMPDDVYAAFQAVERWADEQGMRARITKPRGKNRKRRSVDTLEPEQFARLMSAIDTRGATQIRSRAIIALMDATGLRIGEALALRTDSIDKSEPDVWRVLVPCEDGCKTGARVVPFRAQRDGEPTAAHKELERWEARRFPEGDHLFNTSSGESLTYQGFRRSLSVYATRAGVPVKPHTFRHTYATRLMQKGVDTATIASLLGHSNPSVTSSYYLHSNDARMSEVVRQYL